MRIWDLNPGYLNRQSLLGEHRELHGIVSIVQNGKRGYSRHPETRRWSKFGWALRQRHELLLAEMRLRGYSHASPVLTRRQPGEWPDTFLDSPATQFDILRTKYTNKTPGRIPLPDNAQQLWAQHKYSVMARNPSLYRELGPRVSCMRTRVDFSALSGLLIAELRKPPATGHLRNALQHMWGHVAEFAGSRSPVSSKSQSGLIHAIQQLAQEHREQYLLQSTALSELVPWVAMLDRRDRRQAA